MAQIADLFFVRSIFGCGTSRRYGDGLFDRRISWSAAKLRPTVTMPLHFGPWLDVTPSFTLRTTYYGGQVQNGRIREPRIFPDDGRVFVGPAAVFAGPRVGTRQDEVEARDRAGYGLPLRERRERFGKYVRFDEDETLTDTNEVQYGDHAAALPARRGRRRAEKWRACSITQKYFFDPTFGGALVSGQRNVFRDAGCADAVCVCGFGAALFAGGANLRSSRANISIRK